MSLTACRHSAGDAACGEVVVVQDEVAGASTRPSLYEVGKGGGVGAGLTAMRGLVATGVQPSRLTCYRGSA